MTLNAYRFWALLLLLLLPLSQYGQQGEPALADKYYQDGEYANALELYAKLQKRDPRNQEFNVRVADCYTQMEQYQEAIDFLEKVIQKNKTDFFYSFMQADLYRLVGEPDKAGTIEDRVISKELMTQFDFKQTGTWLSQQNKFDLALKTYLQGRKTLKSKYMFGTEIATLYAALGEYGLSAEEFVEQYQLNPAMSNAVKTNVLAMTDADSRDEIEQVLLSAVNKNSNDLGLREMLYEFYVLVEDFYEAFVQVKSMDKVFRENGQRLYRFALTMRNNEQYSLSNKALDYIIENHTGSSYYLKAYQEKTVNNELQAFKELPLDTNDVRQAVVAYDALLDRFGRKAQFFDAMYRKANLLAFYLFDLDAALTELELLANQPLQPKQMAEANLLIGDILLMQKEYSKARLKYNEVADAFHEDQIGALAKFRQGRLSYFKGDFEYAQARLQTIKDNTGNDISNDAIQLFLLIQDNMGLDTTTYALERFAQAQLLVFQRDFEPALELLDSIAYAFPGHMLNDEILWEKANIFLKQGETEKALVNLDKIISVYPEDIHGDDALFTKAQIYDYTLHDPEQAMDLYIEFLKNYSGSLYVVEVRKRIRELRRESKRI